METFFRHWRIAAFINVIIGCLMLIAAIHDGRHVFEYVYGLLGWCGLWRLIIWNQGKILEKNNG